MKKARKKPVMVRVNKVLLQEIASNIIALKEHLRKLTEIHDLTDWREKYHDLRALIEHERPIFKDRERVS